MDSKKKGNIGEISCMFYFECKGYTVLTPFGDRNRYDMVIEKDNIFKRIQVKYVTPKNNYIEIPLQSNTKTNGMYKKHKYTIDEIDYIYVYTPNKQYLIPIEDFEGQGLITLRLNKPKNNQTKNVNFAIKYVLQ